MTAKRERGRLESGGIEQKVKGPMDNSVTITGGMGA